MALSRGKKIGFTLLALSFFWAVLFILAEIFLYFFNPQLPAFLRPDSVVGTMHFSDYTVRQRDACIQATIRFNHEGMNDIDHTVEKPEGVYRIAVIGDSYVEAMQFPLEQAYFRVLEHELKEAGKKVEVLAFGVGGFGTLQEYHLLKEYALKYKPDLVILSFFSYNDVRNNSFELERSLDMPYATVDEKGELLFQPFQLREEYVKTFESPLRTLIFERSHLVRFIYRLSNHSIAFRNFLAHFGLQTPALEGQTKHDVIDELYMVEMKPEWERAWQVTEALVKKIKVESEAAGADFILFSLSNNDQLSEEKFSRIKEKYPNVELDRKLPENRLDKFSNQENIRYLAALPTMERLHERGVIVHPECHGHWSEEASLVGGNILSHYLLKNILNSPYTAEAK